MSKYLSVSHGNVKGSEVGPIYDKLLSEYRPELEGRNPVTIKTTRRRIRSLCTGIEAFTDRVRHKDTGVEKDLIVIPHNVSTKGRVHEITHWELGHTTTPSRGLDDTIRREWDTEYQTMRSRGKPGVRVEYLGCLARGLLAQGYTPNEIISAIKRVIPSAKANKGVISWVWHGLKEAEKSDK